MLLAPCQSRSHYLVEFRPREAIKISVIGESFVQARKNKRLLSTVIFAYHSPALLPLLECFANISQRFYLIRLPGSPLLRPSIEPLYRLLYPAAFLDEANQGLTHVNSILFQTIGQGSRTP
jgi:hypothetical protein